MKRRLLVAAVCLPALLAACATPRTAADDAAIHRVTVIPLIAESGTVDKLGFTVFNNARTTIAQGGALNRQAMETVGQALRASRPGWTIVPATADFPSLAARLEKLDFFGGDLAKVQADIDAIMKATGADAVVVVSDLTPENVAGRGVGVRLRTLPGATPRLTAYAHLYVELRDPAGHRLSGFAGIAEKDLDARSLGVTGDLESVETPAVRARLSEAMRDQADRAISDALQRQGY